MIFRQVDDVKSGRKYMTRRMVQPGEHMEDIPGTTVTNVYKNSRFKWGVYCRYAVVPKMGQKGIGFIELKHIHQERLHDITERDALAEGVASVAEYRALWESLYGAKSWDANPWVWVLSFVWIGERI